jgi:arsenate reductase
MSPPVRFPALRPCPSLPPLENIEVAPLLAGLTGGWARRLHNKRCSKSRAACQLIAESGVPAEIIDYLTIPPSREELRALLSKLGMQAHELVRRGESVFREYYAGRTLSDEEWLDALVAHPILIERPIVVRGDRAVLGRPPEKVLELLA